MNPSTDGKKGEVNMIMLKTLFLLFVTLSLHANIPQLKTTFLVPPLPRWNAYKS